MIVFLIFLLILGAAIELISLHPHIDDISYKFYSSSAIVEPDETFDVVSVLRNKYRRFFPFIRITNHLPKGTQVLREDVLHFDDVHSGVVISNTAYLMSKQEVETHIPISIPQRGRYFIHDSSIAVGDFLGLSEKQRQFSQMQEIVVLPKPYPSPKIDSVLGGFLGDVSANRFIMEDPVLTLGFREYSGREPMKSISWAQSARFGKLLVKNYDHTVEPCVSVILNVECDVEEPNVLIEKCFSISRSVCEYLEKRNIKYDFLTNATAAGALGCWSLIGEGLGQRHLMSIIEGLGRATYEPAESFESILSGLSFGLSNSRAIVLVTPEYPAKKQQGLLNTMSNGCICTICAQEV